ncbi:MAG: energy transducer TonB [Proteobacteria bacterium]|nr:energy transducer TonB [Pseudomonadota bacterium]
MSSSSPHDSTGFGQHGVRRHGGGAGPAPLRRASLAILVAAAHVAGLLAMGWIAQQKRIEPVERPIEVALIQAEAPRPPTPPTPAPQPPVPEVRQPAPPTPPRIQPRPQARPRVQPPVKQASVAPAPLSTSPGAVSAEAPAAAPPPPAAAPAPVAAAPVAVTAARFDADYLNNPAPPYPPLSRRMREEGKVMLKVLVSAAGLPERIELARSSGSERLDRAAEDAVRRWKFVAARQGEQPVESWVLVPIIFKLQES